MDHFAELMPLKMNLDIMLPWLEWWGVDAGATRLFFRLDVQTQNEIWEQLGGELGSKPGGRLVSAIRHAENEKCLTQASNCELSQYPDYTTDDVHSICRSLEWLGWHHVAVFLLFAHQT
jgi:hypothetical protein